MSSKSARRELLRALVLAALLSTPYMGVGAEDASEDPYPIKGNTISREHMLQGQYSLFELNGEQKVTATDDVSVRSELNYEIEDPVVYIFDGNETAGKLDLNMNDHSLTIDSGYEFDIFFVNQSDTQVNIHNADNIEATARFGAIVNASKQSGNSISLQANKDIRLIQAEGYQSDPSLTVAGDNQLNLNAGEDLVLQHDEFGSMMSISENAKATLKAGQGITFNTGYITSEKGGSLEMEAGNITFNEADINVLSKGELQMTAGNDIKVNGEGFAGMNLDGGGILHMEAGQITFDNADIEAKEEATLEMNSGKDITFDNGNIDIQSGAKIQMNAGNDFKLDNTNVNVQDEAALTMDAGNDIALDNADIDLQSGAKLKMDAGKDITFDKTNVSVQEGANLTIDNVNNIVFNKTNDESDSSSLYVDAGSNAALTAKNDIRFNRGQDGIFIELRYNEDTPGKGIATASITAEGNIIFHEDQTSNSSAIYMNNAPTLRIEAQVIKGNTQRLAETTWYADLSLIADDIEWIAQEPAGESTGLEDDTNMVFSASGSKINFDADNAVTLSTAIAPTLIFADYGGDVRMHAGKSIYLHNAGNDAGYTDYYNDDGDDYYNEYYYNYDYKYQSTLWTNTGIIDLTTTDGRISVDNKGSIAALSEYDGVINFNGNTIIPEAGIGAKSENRGHINFNGDTVISNVDIGAWAETNREYAEEEKSTITFNGDLVIDQAKTGAVAQYDSDIIFNKGLKIQAEDNAFYAESAGRIQTLTDGVDKVIIGNMRAYNGQIDALFDTADSSFTGFTELREIKKVYSSNEDEEEYPDDGTCPLEPGPGDCGDVEYPDEEIVDEGTCPIDPEPGDCGGGVDYGGCEDPVVDEGSHINITLRNGAFWDVTGDSTLTKLDNDSLVNMTDGTRSGTSITAKNLSGTGTIAMDLDWTSNGGAKEKTEHSDYIVATESATGTQTVVSDPATMHLDSMGIDDRLYFATLTNSDAVFTSPITQQNVTKGSLYDYTIGITSETTVTTETAENIADRAATDTTTDWFFGTIGYTESPLVETGRINSNIMYDLVTDVDTLNKRMGDVRQMNTDPDGWWARTTYTHQDRDSYSGHSNRFELGKDFVMTRDDGSTVHQGAVFTYLRSSDSFDNGNGKYKRYSGSLYHTWLGNNGQYVDVVGRIGKVMGNSHTFLINGTQSDSSFGTWYQQASVETGKTYDLEDGWYFEPQAQLQYTHMNSKSYTSRDGINHDLDSVNSFIGRLGFRLGQKLNDKTSWYVKGDILHEFSGDGGIMLTSANGLERIDYNRDGKDTWYDLGAGLTAELSPASSLWFEFERKFSGTYSNDWEFNGGISWKF
ncbi:autotransporter outer membrane beta-barrel domain-containing protein [uncultured Megasphaera sp.]|uniref:autotransporter outer membrane beta-barrel domain-containing protein n=1 Tax=uncultured Megasphaera sp. TaxID=165188 RepID=UPI00266D9933|nr:autotransporter outer membrane beta-barrel domain-containing protein [uncultured Megasphaera sp.]